MVLIGHISGDSSGACYCLLCVRIN